MAVVLWGGGSMRYNMMGPALLPHHVDGDWGEQLMEGQVLCRLRMEGFEDPLEGLLLQIRACELLWFSSVSAQASTLREHFLRRREMERLLLPRNNLGLNTVRSGETGQIPFTSVQVSSSK